MNRQLDLVPYTPVPEYYPSEMFKEVPSKYDSSKSDILTEIALNKDHRLDLIKDGYLDKNVGGYFFPVFILWLASMFLCLYFAVTGISTSTGTIFFTISSLLFGPLLAFIMLEIDENDGFRALKIVFFTTLITGSIGYSDIYSFSENEGLVKFLFISLLGLISFEFIKVLRGFSRKTVKRKAIFGAFSFSVFLLVDFNKIRKESDMGINDWDTAFTLAFSIYLDIINLLLEILDAISD
jgi:FtsH-binding integral membrane protein